MDKVYVIKFDYSIIAVARTRADAEELVCDLAMERGLDFFNLWMATHMPFDEVLTEVRRHMDYFTIDEYNLI